jgi:ketosteroid isomerase-like protein
MTASQDLTSQTIALVQKYLTALGSRNLDSIVHFFSEQIYWDVPGNKELAPWLGKRNSKAEIREFFEMLWAETEPKSVNLDHIFAKDNHAVITGEFSTLMLKTGKVYSSIFAIHLTIENNLITSYRLQEDSYALTQALQ